ncbi:MAG TPA: hypothetical protein VNL18_11170 [Gemmatimonadales bacterium]|nr:hypothetical protein [Gemmatimonadales bacterium]
MKGMEQAGLQWEQVGATLAATPTSGIALKGGGRWPDRLWESTKAEFHVFLCTESPNYADLRQQWDALRKKSSTIAVSALSATIGAQIGVAAGVIAPLVIWLALVALRIGKEALCRAVTQQPPPAPGQS